MIFVKKIPFALGLCAMLWAACGNGDDARAWQAVMSSPSQDAVDSFLLKYPNSSYKEAALQKKEDFIWQSALNDNTEFGYRNYQKIYPAGKYNELVQAKIDSIPADNITLAALTTQNFVGKISLNGREIKVLSMRFVKIEEAAVIRFEASINVPDARKNLLGSIDKTKMSLTFEENGQEPVLGLSTARAYIRDKQIWIESTDLNQFWRVRCDL